MKIQKFFDNIEDKLRHTLSRYPVIYSLIGGIAVVLFWRGVWMIADEYYFMTGWVSFIVSVVILLAIGLFVSFFIGDQILISGMKREKKIAEKTIDEIKSGEQLIVETHQRISKISEQIEEVKNILNNIKTN